MEHSHGEKFNQLHRCVENGAPPPPPLSLEADYLRRLRDEFQKFYEEAIDPGLKIAWARMVLEATRLLTWKEQSSPALPLSVKLPSVNLRSTRSVRLWVTKVVGLLWRGEIDPRVASAIFQGFTVLRGGFDLDMIQQLKQLEKMVGEIRAAQLVRVTGTVDGSGGWSGAVGFQANPPPPEPETSRPAQETSREESSRAQEQAEGGDVKDGG